MHTLKKKKKYETKLHRGFAQRLSQQFQVKKVSEPTAHRCYGSKQRMKSFTGNIIRLRIAPNRTLFLKQSTNKTNWQTIRKLVENHF